MKKAIIIVSTIVVVLLFACFLTYKVIFISRSEVKDIVSEHLNVREDDIKKWDIEFAYDGGIFIYEVELVYNNLEYEYEIDARSGEVILYKLDH